jgi:tetratricopeptide (TPR) repeat protein
MAKLLYGFIIVALLYSGVSGISWAQNEFPEHEADPQEDIEKNVNEMLSLFDEVQNDEKLSRELLLLKNGKNNANEPDPLEEFAQSDENLNPARGSAEKNNAKNKIETANEVVRFDADTPEGHFQLGLEFWLSKNLDKAIDQFQQVVRVTPENAHAYWNLGLLYDENNRGPEAIANMKKAQAIYSKYKYSTYAEEAGKRIKSFVEKYGPSATSISSPE